ncbi:hypothetical protein ACFE04_023409 [Oxalis oulophora]
MADSNLHTLYDLGACLLHGVNASSMKFHPNLNFCKFDRIIFNFPHAGFYRKESDPHQIRMHMNVVDGFLNNARDMLRYDGEIHINHKTKVPYKWWNLQQLAINNDLVIFECVDFKIEDYPGYNHKRGAGDRCDEQNISAANGYTCRMQQYYQTPMAFRHSEANFFQPATNRLETNAYYDVNSFADEDNWTTSRNYDWEAPEESSDYDAECLSQLTSTGEDNYTYM